MKPTPTAAPAASTGGAPRPAASSQGDGLSQPERGPQPCQRRHRRATAGQVGRAGGCRPGAAAARHRPARSAACAGRSEPRRRAGAAEPARPRPVRRPISRPPSRTWPRRRRLTTRWSPGPMQAELAAAKAALTAAQQDYAQVRAGPSAQDLAQLKALADNAQGRAEPGAGGIRPGEGRPNVASAAAKRGAAAGHQQSALRRTRRTRRLPAIPPRPSCPQPRRRCRRRRPRWIA